MRDHFGSTLPGPTEGPGFVELPLGHVVVDPLKAASFFFVKGRVGELLVLACAQSCFAPCVAGDHGQGDGGKHEPHHAHQDQRQGIDLSAKVATSKGGVTVVVVLRGGDGAFDLPTNAHLDGGVVGAWVCVVRRAVVVCIRATEGVVNRRPEDLPATVGLVGAQRDVVAVPVAVKVELLAEPEREGIGQVPRWTVAAAVTVSVRPLRLIVREGIALLFTEHEEHAGVGLVLNRDQLEQVVVPSTVAVAVHPLEVIVGEDVVHVSPTVEVGVGASVATRLVRTAVFVDTGIASADRGVVTKTVAVGVVPLERVGREGVHGVRVSVAIGVRASAAHRGLGTARVQRTNVARFGNAVVVFVDEVVTKSVTVGVLPLKRIAWEAVTVRSAWVVAVAVTVGVGPLR